MNISNRINETVRLCIHTSRWLMQKKRIYEKISDICISMKAADYIEMPERIDNVYEVEMNDKEMKLYRKLEKEMFLPFADGDIDAVNAASLSNKLLQLANGAVYDENQNVKKIHNRKLEALEDLIEASNGRAYWCITAISTIRTE